MANRRTRHQLALLALGLCALASLAIPTAAQSETRERTRVERTITVSAAAQIAVEPDIAHVSSGVQSEAETARDALTRNSAAMSKMIDGLKGRGIDARDIQTVHFGIEPRYSHLKDQPSRITGYRVTNSIRIVVRDIKRVGEVLDSMVSLGANLAAGIAFEVSKAETLKDEARRQAIANALRRAKLLAEAAGAEVGQVIAISEEVQGPTHRAVAAGRAALAAEAVPVEAGSKTLEARVHVTWGLK